MNPPSPFPNLVCWQQPSRLEVMNTVALSVRASVFNATHFPSPIRRLNVASAEGSSAPYSELELLKDFLNPASERLFSVAVGDTGTGKSHLVRWLWQQVEDRGSKRLRIIRIPRHASNLADVLRIIVAGDFKGEAVETIRRELEGTSNVTPQGARERVLDELAFVLGPENRQQSTLKFPDDDIHQEMLLPFLPPLLRDSAVRKHLCEPGEAGIVGRLARHVLGSRQERLGSPPNLRWAESDLAFPPIVATKAGAEARQLASSLLTDLQLRQNAAAVLNQALGEALPGLVGLKRGNLRQAMLEIRKQLKVEGCQLLLFIEDMSVSQGMDAELIESLIVKPSEEEGKLCVLRSIVGLTHDDFKTLLPNIRRGRIDLAVTFDVGLAAKKGEGLSEEEIADFASRYLNAARYSLVELDSWVEKAAANAELPSFCEASRCPNRDQCHKVYGQENGRGLYPLNRTAILRLYEKLEERTAFNPRTLVGGVLNDFLTRAESQLTAGAFPGSDFREWFGLATTVTNVQREVQQRYGTAASRVITALEIYAQNPNSGKLPAGLPETLGLPKDSGGKPADSQETKTEPKPKDQEKNRASVQDDFDRWLNQKRVDGPTLNRWRESVFQAMRGARDWDSDPSGPLFTSFFPQRFIHFAGQTVQRAGDVKLEIDPSPEIATALRGLVDGFKTRDELLLAVHWVEKWTDNVCKQLRARAEAPGEIKPLEAAVHLLALGALVRGKATQESSREEFLAAALEEWNELPATAGSTSSWALLREGFARLAPNLRNWLLQNAGAGKGGEVRSLFVDTAQILDAVKSSYRSVSIGSFGEDFGANWAPDIYGPVIDMGRRVGKHLAPALEQEANRCEKWLAALDSACGNHTSASLGENLKLALNKGTEASVFNNPRLADVTLLCENFVNGKVEEAIRAARGVVGDKAQNRRLTLLATLDRPIMREAEDLLQLAWSELRSADAKLARLIKEAGAGDLEALSKEVRAELAALCKNIETLIGGLGNE